MPDNSHLPRLIDASALAELATISKATVWRHHEAEMISAGCKIVRAVRWRLRMGDPSTGILDWLEAGCPARTEARPSTQMEGPCELFIAERLQVQPDIVRVWSRRGRIPVIRITPKVVRYDFAAVLARLAAGETGSEVSNG